MQQSKDGVKLATSHEHNDGGGASKMATDTGLPVEQCKKFIEAYYTRYKGVKEWQNEVARQVRASREPSTRKTAKGFPAGVGVYVSPTGRRYSFVEYDAPEWSIVDTTFSPTQMKNRPVQGFSTGDIVPIGFAEAFKRIRSDEELVENCLLVNTIHDSVIADCKIEQAPKAILVLKQSLESVPKIMEELWGITFPVPIKVEFEIGESWGSLKKLSF